MRFENVIRQSHRSLSESEFVLVAVIFASMVVFGLSFLEQTIIVTNNKDEDTVLPTRIDLYFTVDAYQLHKVLKKRKILKLSAPKHAKFQSSHRRFLFLTHFTAKTTDKIITNIPKKPQLIEMHTQAGVILTHSDFTIITVAAINQATRMMAAMPKE